MPFVGHITIRDGEGKTSTMTLYNTSAAVADTGDVLNRVEAVAAAILPYIDGEITDLGVTVSGAIPAGNTAADPHSNTQEKALFILETAEGRRGRVAVPTIVKEVAFVPGEDDAVPAFETAMRAALIGDGTLGFGMEPESNFTELVEGYQTYTNRKRRQ